LFGKAAANEGEERDADGPTKVFPTKVVIIAAATDVVCSLFLLSSFTSLSLSLISHSDNCYFPQFLFL
jgi:hypothetical protein